MTSDAVLWLVPSAAYVHIPFCAHHCGYCDFAVSTDSHLKELYLDALELELRGEPAAIETLFLGGGTPTSLSPEQLTRLLQLLESRFPGGWRECTIETTPDSITPEKLALLKAHGVTRVSIGVQSFLDATRSSLDRSHNREEINAAIDAVAESGLQVSYDLIFGAPGQSLADWNEDLRIVAERRPDHVSTYGLTFEKGTPFWKQRQRGEIHSLGEDLELAMYEAAIESLTQSGYEHYEISSFARDGRRCRHNEHYWANHAYYGFGVGAARYISGERAHNVRDTKVYIQRVLSGEDATQQRETLPLRERAFETIAVQLRRSEGIRRDSFQTQTGFDLDDLIGSVLPHLVAEGLLTDIDRRVALTHRGKCLADAVIEKLMTTDVASPR